MPAITKVAVAGGTGELGNAVVVELLSAGFTLTILSRKAGKLPAQITSHASVKEVTVDYSSASSLDSALSGIDAVVSTLGNQTLEQQKALYDAAERAHVQRFLPSEFGCNLEQPETRTLPVFGAKVALEDYIIERVGKGSETSYSLIFTNAFLDWGLQHGFLIDITGRKATIFDGGNYAFSVTRLSTIGKAVVGVLQHPEETKNRAIFVHDGRLTGKELYEWSKAAGSNQEWTVKEDSTEATAKRSMEALSKGVYEEWVWHGFLDRAALAEATDAGFEKTDNELLGIKTLDTAEMKTLVQEIARPLHS